MPGCTGGRKGGRKGGRATRKHTKHQRHRRGTRHNGRRRHGGDLGTDLLPFLLMGMKHGYQRTRGHKANGTSRRRKSRRN